MALAAAAMAVGLLSGCASTPEPDVSCSSYGFQTGTDGHAMCVQQEMASRRAALAAFGSAYAAGMTSRLPSYGQPPPFPPAPQMVRCRPWAGQVYCM
jgi:hypothetical protein